MATVGITNLFGANLAALLAEKIEPIYSRFDAATFVSSVDRNVAGKTYTQRVAVIANALRDVLPQDYPEALAILERILGPENPDETGMFKNYYWILPLGNFIQTYGLDHFELSMNAIAEVTKRNTGEYAVRPYIRRFPERTLRRLRRWAQSDNFHLRRLASEGLRPKLPWAPKLEQFVDHPEPVFEILELLKADQIKFVRKSVANHLTDYLKVNPRFARQVIERWRASGDQNTQWTVERATRKYC